MKIRVLIALLVLLALPSLVSAQTPWQVAFPANPNHATVAQGVDVVQGYQLVVTPQGESALAPQTLGKPAPTNGTIAVNVDGYLSALPAGTYTAVIKAVGPGGSAVSPESSPFSLVVPAPGPQGAPIVSKSGGA